MKLTRFFALGTPVYVARDNEGGDAGQGDAGTGDAAGQAANVADTNAGTLEGQGERTFTQDEVNEFVVKRNKALKTQYETLEKNYEGLLKQQNLTNEQRGKLETELEGVRAALRTKEEQAKLDAKKASEAHSVALKEQQEQASFYKNLYETSTIEREIVTAATEHEGFNPQLFIPIVGPRTKMVAELDGQGNKTGKLVPRVEDTVTGDDGNPTTVQLTVNEAIAAMKEKREYGSLFKSNAARGIGQGSEGGGAAGTLDPSKMSMEEYVAHREQIHSQYGIRKRR